MTKSILFSELDLIPLFVTFLFCLFLSLEIGIVIGTAVNLAMLLYATARPRINILKFQVSAMGFYLFFSNVNGRFFLGQ